MNTTYEKYAFIWDIDGTLLDSYDEIMGSAMSALEEYGFHYNRDEIYRECIRTSVTRTLREIADANSIPTNKISERFEEIHDSRWDEAKLAPNVKEILSWLTERGIRNYVFTHRGGSMNPVLKHAGLLPYFTETVGMDGTFPRKPEPDGLLYLAKKYALDKAYTFYVGDRTIDMACAKNAGMKGIFYKPSFSVGIPDGCEDYLIHDLLEIREILP